ncbi:MAG: hypothetical protein ACLFVU_02435 [Phycisphaerae bacterium]
MRRHTLLLALLLTTSLAAGQTTQTTDVPDYCSGLVDPYNMVVEKDRFNAAAGNDGELSAAEFTANQKNTSPFARAFDTWAMLKTFDENANGTIDWFEADAYRKALAKKVAGNFDANKNNRLEPAERAKANAALHAGRISADGGATTHPATDRGSGENGNTAENADAESGEPNPRRSRRQRLLDRYDTDGDGKVSAEERNKAVAEWRERIRKRMEERRKQQLEKYDTDGDGELSEAEREKMEQQRRQERQKRVREWLERRFDADKDGKLDAEEQKRYDEAVKKYEERMKRFRQRARQWREQRIKRYDTDGDGKLSETEREEARKQMRQRIEEFRKAADADGDGKTTRSEIRDYWQKLRKKYDANGDGKLDAKERQKLMEEEGGSVNPSSGGSAAVIPSSDGKSATVIHTGR